MKITIENQAILRRLQDKTSNYSVVRWEEDYRNTEKMMKSMCEYPFVLAQDPNLAKNRLSMNESRAGGARYSTADGGEQSDLLSRGGLPRIATAASGNRS